MHSFQSRPPDRRSFNVQAASGSRTSNKANGSMKFTGTKDYVATDDLKVAVNASIVL